VKKREGEKKEKKYRKKRKNIEKREREKCARRGVRVNLQDPHESKTAIYLCLQAVALHISRKTFCCLAPLILALVRACKASP
jgi:hypothetical protein